MESALSPRVATESETARLRREQIIAAAVEIIATRGLHNLSLSKIEALAGMKRGQLTYYFPTKEDILLAVFDRLLLLICEQMREGRGSNSAPEAADAGCHWPAANVWDGIQKLFRTVLHAPPRYGRAFHALEYTFLAQIAHREDFRQKLATVFEEWRRGMAEHWSATAPPAAQQLAGVSGRTVSSFVQALLHGFDVQLAADPNAFDRGEMLSFCLRLLAPLFLAQGMAAQFEESRHE